MRSTAPSISSLVRLLVLLIGGTLLGTNVGVAQESAGPLGQIESAFRAGDADQLLEGASNRLDVVIFGKGASYSRAQARLVLADFFRRNPPKRVSFEQEVLAEDRKSMIGQYWVAEDGSEPVNVSVRLRSRRKGWQLRSIRIERG